MIYEMREFHIVCSECNIIATRTDRCRPGVVFHPAVPPGWTEKRVDGELPGTYIVNHICEECS